MRRQSWRNPMPRAALQWFDIQMARREVGYKRHHSRRTYLGSLQTARNGTGGQSRLPAELALAFADKLFTDGTQPFSALAPCMVLAFYVVAYGATFAHMVDLSGFLCVVRIYFCHDAPPFDKTQALELALPTPQVWHEAQP